MFSYFIGDKTINHCNLFKDLGVIFDIGFNSDDHVNSIVFSVTKLLGLIIKNISNFKIIDVIKILFFIFIGFRLEFYSIIWNPKYNPNPKYNFQINLLEKVQRKFVKYLSLKIDDIHLEILTHRYHLRDLT